MLTPTPEGRAGHEFTMPEAIRVGGALAVSLLIATGLRTAQHIGLLSRSPQQQKGGWREMGFGLPAAPAETSLPEEAA